MLEKSVPDEAERDEKDEVTCGVGVRREVSTRETVSFSSEGLEWSVTVDEEVAR